MDSRKKDKTDSFTTGTIIFRIEEECSYAK